MAEEARLHREFIPESAQISFILFLPDLANYPRASSLRALRAFIWEEKCPQMPFFCRTQLSETLRRLLYKWSRNASSTYNTRNYCTRGYLVTYNLNRVIQQVSTQPELSPIQFTIKGSVRTKLLSQFFNKKKRGMNSLTTPCPNL